MFESIRSHRRWLMVFMLVLIFPSFVFFGIQGYNRFVESEGALAQVDGVPITQREFEIAQRDRADRLRQQFGADFDPKVLDTPEGRASILEGLVIDRALAREAEAGNLIVTNDRLREVIASIPAFQEDNRFSLERYRTFLTAQGQTEQQFEERVRSDLRKQMLVQAVLESAIVPAASFEQIERALLEQREVRMLAIRADALLPKVTVTDAQVAEFYEKRRKDFETPESIKVEYVVLNADAIAGKSAVAESDVQSYYEQNKGRYGVEEQRRASHILITPESGDKAAARAKAESILSALKAKPDDFAKLARENSKDPGSAAQGGDLGFFGKGMMVKPFEDTAFKLKVGETSDIVETDFGFHIIRVTEIKPAQAKPLAEVRGEIERELRTQQGQKHYAEAADQFTNLVYEQADSLKPAADKLGLKIETRDQVTRTGVPAAAGELQVFQPKVVEALFAEDALKNRRNTQALEIAPSTLVAARVVDHRPAAVRPLDEVKAGIRQRLEREEAGQLARKDGEARMAELLKQPSDTGFSPPLTVSRRAPQGVPPTLLAEILRTRTDKLPTYVGADVEGAGYVIAQVIAAKEGAAPDPAQRDAERRALARQGSAADEIAFAEGLRSRHKAKVLRPEYQRPAAKATGAETKADIK